MTCYDFSKPRTALGLAAVAMTGITFGALVVLPATFESGSADWSVFAAPEDGRIRALGKAQFQSRSNDEPESQGNLLLR